MSIVVVGIPWRPTPERQRAYDYVVKWYSHMWSEVPIISSDSGHEPFNRAASRNAAVREAEAAGAEIVVLNDADTVPDIRCLHMAIRGAIRDGGLHFGLDRMAYLTEDETEAFYADRWKRRDALPHDSSVLVIRPADYWAIGGQDERFDGWGGEDGAFTSAAKTLSTVVWHEGLAVSLHHADAARDVGSIRWWPNGRLATRYANAIGDPSAMRNLIEERD